MHTPARTPAQIDERLIFYEGKHVRLKALTADDVLDSGWVGWFNDEQMSVHNQHHYFPNTVEAQLEILKTLNTPTKLQLGILDRADQAKICGVVSLSSIDWINRNAEIGGVQDRSRTAGNPALFLESWSLMLRHAFAQLGLHKVYGGTLHPHVPDALTRAFNFEREGVRRRHVYKNGAFADITLVAVYMDTVRYPEF
jgi:ribosomal-protein-alanine N-acetyltransferase